MAVVRPALVVGALALVAIPSAFAGSARTAAPVKPVAATVTDASPGALVVGMHLPDPGFQVGAVAGDRITYVAGLEADLARAIAERLRQGAPAFVQLSLDRLTAPGTKKWEIALARLSPTTGGPVAWSAPYLRAGPVVLARKRLPSPGALADLASVQLCTTAGSRGRVVIVNRIRPTVAPLVAIDDRQLVGWIRTGRCDAALREAPELALAVEGRPDAVGKLVGIVDTGRSYAVAVPRTTKLLPRVDGAIAYLRTKGIVHELAMRWLGFDPNRLRPL